MEPADLDEIRALQVAANTAQEALRVGGQALANKYVNAAKEKLAFDTECIFQCEKNEAVVYAPRMVTMGAKQ